MKLFLFFVASLAPISVFADSYKKTDVVLQEIVVANVWSDEPACHVSFPVRVQKCTSKGCEFAAPKTSSLTTVWLNFSCLPASAPTGFENQQEGEEVFPVQGPNARGSVSLMDNPVPEDNEPVRELSFCLFGERTNFCGWAKTYVLKDGKKGDVSGEIVQFVKSIILMGENVPSRNDR
ncbi:MAG: hypothetical protein ACJ8LG_25145 [Massilia sp.]